jgi:hypothetical protein
VLNVRLRFKRGRARRRAPAIGNMLRQEELAFLKALGHVELSPVFLRELRKAVAAGKKKKALAASKASTASIPAPQRPRGVGEGRYPRDSQHIIKRKAVEPSSSDCPSEPGSRRPAPEHLFGDGPEGQGNTGEQIAHSSRQLGFTEGGLAYAAVVAEVANLQQRSGPHKSEAKGSNP